jgi:hypothetical protein
MFRSGRHLAERVGHLYDLHRGLWAHRLLHSGIGFGRPGRLLPQSNRRPHRLRREPSFNDVHAALNAHHAFVRPSAVDTRRQFALR